MLARSGKACRPGDLVGVRVDRVDQTAEPFLDRTEEDLVANAGRSPARADHRHRRRCEQRGEGVTFGDPVSFSGRYQRVGIGPGRNANNHCSGILAPPGRSCRG